MLKRVKQARLTTEELHEIKWLMGGVLTLLSLWSLFSLEFQSGASLMIGILCVWVSLLIPGWIARIPLVVWRIVGPVFALVIAADFALSLPQFLPPLMRMIIYLLIFRALSPRRSREDLQLILLCLFSVVVSGVLTVSLLFAFQILIFTPIAMAMLFVICLLDVGLERANYQPSWQHFRWTKLIGRVWQVLDFRVLTVGSLLFAFVVCASTLLFVLIPRFNLGQAIPFLQLETASKSGFNGEVRLGDVTEIREENSIALRIDVPSLEAMEGSPYWRMLVLDEYKDGAFTMSAELKTLEFQQYREERELPGWSIPVHQQQGQLWTFYLEGGISEYLPIPGPYHLVRFASFQNLVHIPAINVLGLSEVRQSVFFYQIEDLVWTKRFPASDQEVTSYANYTEPVEDPIYPYTAIDLNLSDEDRKFLAELNDRLVDKETMLSTARYSQIVTDYLRKEFRYSLQPNGQGEGDAFVSWLRNGNRGHCELFAGSFTLLAREAGYPTRMVVGFAGGSWNTIEEYFVVRNRDAHAWVEIYDHQSHEWLRIDPTPGASPSDPEQVVRGSFLYETGFAAWTDSLRIQWYRRIVNFDQQDQLELVGSVDTIWEQLKKAMSLRSQATLTAMKGWFARPFTEGNMIRFGFVLALVGFVIFAWRARYSYLSLLFRLMKRPQSMDPVRKQAGQYLRRFREKAEQLELEDGEALNHAYAAIRRDLQALRFGPKTSATSAKAVFAKARQALRRRWDRASD